AQGRYAEAETAFQEALRLRLKLLTPGAIATVYRGLGAIAVARGRYDEARQHFQQALQLALSTKWIGTLLHSFVEIAELYAQTGEVNKALELLLAVLRDGRIVVPMQKRIRTRIAALRGALPEELATPLPPSGGRLDVEALARTLLAALDLSASPEGANVPMCEGANVPTCERK
ncbi:MAG TPA: tetratricopeptide repeat protein, partial [Anaerolineae bacterium]|nr:tetratricopeptide repeat protein [Anaerolineae bacterium]